MKYKIIATIVMAFVFTGAILIYSLNPDEESYIQIIAENIEILEGETIDLAIDSSFDLTALTVQIRDENILNYDEFRFEGLQSGETIITVSDSSRTFFDYVRVVVHSPDKILERHLDTITVTIENQTFDYDAPINLKDLSPPSRDGHSFVGWNNPSGGLLSDDYVIESSMVLHPVYETIVSNESFDHENPEVQLDNDPDLNASTETADPETNEASINTDVVDVQLVTDDGKVLDTIIIDSGTHISETSFAVNITPESLFLEGSLCDSPYDFNAVITQSIILVVDQSPVYSPCIELDHILLTGHYRVDESINVHVSPNGASVEYRWFMSEDNRSFYSISHTGASLTLNDTHLNKYLAVNVIGTHDYTGILKTGTPRILNNTLIINGEQYIPIASSRDLIAMNSTRSFVFAEGTSYEMVASGGPSNNYALINNLNLESINWVPLFEEFSGFSGKFSGQGYTISNLTISRSNWEIGLFSRLDGALIEDLAFQNASIEALDSIDDMGIIAGTTRSNSLNIIRNVTITQSTISTDGYDGIDQGGLIGDSNGELFLDNISIMISMTGIGQDIGGLVGQLNGNLTASNIVVHGDIGTQFESGDIGGFIGEADFDGHISITDSSNYATVSGGLDVAGFIGYLDDAASVVFNNTNNLGSVFGRGDMGGFIGELEASDSEVTFLDSSNTGSINYIFDEDGYSISNNGSDIGGFIGYLDSAAHITFENSHNHGSIFGRGDVGGFIGELGATDSEVSFLDSTNGGSVNHVFNDVTDLFEGGGDIGGFIGYADQTDFIHFNHSQNNGTISGIDGVGGFIGELDESLYDLTLIIENSTNSGLVTTAIPDGTDEQDDWDGIYEFGGFIGLIEDYKAITLSSISNLSDISLYPQVSSPGVNIAGGIIGLIEVLPGDLTLQNVLNQGDIITSNNDKENYFNISVDIFDDEVYLGTSVGGLIGAIYNDYVTGSHVFITHSSNEGNLSNYQAAGGMIGHFYDYSSSVNVTIAYSQNSGNIQVEKKQAGGFIGYIQDGNIFTVHHSTNSGVISGQLSEDFNDFGREIGGFIGESNEITYIHSSTNLGSVEGARDVGGFIGEMDNTVSISQSANLATISGLYDSGGIIGDSSDHTTLSAVSNHGLIYGITRIGGLLGNTSGPIDLIQSYNVGPITSELNTLIYDELDSNYLDSWDYLQLGGLIGVSKNPTAYPVTLNQTFNAGRITVSTIEDISGGAILFDGVGGLIGMISGTALHIQESFNTGIISAQAMDVGGFIGVVKMNSNQVEPLTIINAFSIGDIHAEAYAGGLIGSLDTTGSSIFENIYVSSVVSQNSLTESSLVAYNDHLIVISGNGVIVNSELTAQIFGKNYGTVSGVVAELDTLDMQKISSYNAYDIQSCSDDQTCSGLNNESIWIIQPDRNGGLPYLRWERD